MGNCLHKKEFTWSDENEPHAMRRKEILTYHPEIKTLFGPDIRLLPCVILMVVAQFGFAYLTQDFSWSLYTPNSFAY